jgi:hypothetical protein
MKMIKRYAIYNDGVQCDWVEAEKGHGGWWCKTDDVEELEKENDKLKEERDQAIEILQSWNDDESPWTETWAFLASLSKDKEEV